MATLEGSSGAESIELDFVCLFSRTKKDKRDIDTKHYLNVLENSKSGLQVNMNKMFTVRELQVRNIEPSLDNQSAMDITIRVPTCFVEHFKVEEFEKCLSNTLQSNAMVNFQVTVTEKGLKSNTHERLPDAGEQGVVEGNPSEPKQRKTRYPSEPEQRKTILLGAGEQDVSERNPREPKQRKTTFKLCIPREVATYVNKVGIIFSNDQEFMLEPCPRVNFYTTDILVPEVNRGMYRYFFEFKERRYYILWKETKREIESINRKIANSSIQRDVMYMTGLIKKEKVEEAFEKCASDHILDIIKEPSSIASKVDEVEDFFERTDRSNGHFDTAELIRKTLLDLSGGYPQQCCYAVLLILCCKCRLHLRYASFDRWRLRQYSLKLIQAIKFVPEAKQASLNDNSDILFEIYKTAHTTSPSVVDFVNQTFSVLSLQNIAALIKDSKQWFSYEDDIPKMEKFFQNFCTESFENECTITIIEAIFERIRNPISILQMLRFFQHNVEQSMHLLSRIIQIANSVCIKSIEEKKKWSNWNEIEKIVSCVGDVIPPQLISYLDKLICDSLLLDRIRQKEFCQMIKSWLDASHIPILHNEESQNIFFDRIKRDQMHLELFRIFTESGTKIHIEAAEMTTNLNAWFHKYCASFPKWNSTSTDILSLLSSVEFATELRFFDSHDYFHKELTYTLSADCLQRYVEVISEVDNMSDRVKDFYIVHLKRLIMSKGSNDLIRNLLRRWTQRIETKLHAMSVEVIISILNFKHDEDHSKRLLSLLPRLQEWTFIASSSGEFAGMVKKNATLCSARICICTLYDDMKNDRFDLQNIENLKAKRNALKEAIHVMTGEAMAVVETTLKCSFETIPRTLKAIDSMVIIMGIVQKSIDVPHLEECIKVQTELLTKAKNDLREGNMSFELYKTSGMPSMQTECASIEPFIKENNKGYHPKLFWKINKKILSESNKDDIVAYELLKFINTTCKDNYITFMNCVLDSSASLHATLPVLSTMRLEDMMMEYEIFRQFSNIDEKKTDIQAFKLFKLENLIGKIDSIYNLRSVIWFEIGVETEAKFQWMKKVAGCNIPETEETIASFVAMVDCIEDKYLYFQDDFKGLLNVLGECSELLTFLEEIKHEDIRNLLDAAEGEHFDQYLPVVSHLIEVKELLLPLIESKDSENAIDCSDCIFLLHDSHEKSKIKNAAVKCDECSKNYTNLRDFYKTFESRTEKTVDKVRNITEESYATFRLKNCTCEYLITCKQDTTDTTVTYSMVELNDLRSRALLIQSRFEKSMDAVQGIYSTELFQSFLAIVDKTSHISNALVELRNLGHPLFLDVKEELSTMNLSAKYNELLEHRRRWEENLKVCRQTCEVVNFIKSDQLPTVYRYLISDIEEEEALSVIDYINPSMRNRLLGSRIFVEEWNASKFKEEPCEVLDSISLELEQYYKEIEPVYKTTDECLKGVSRDLQIKEKGVIFIRLEKDSSGVIPSILSLFHKFLGRLPLANEIILCNENTSFDEIQLLLRRWHMRKTHLSPLHCIAFAEFLPVELQYSLAKELRDCELSRTSTLAILYRGRETDTYPAIFKEHDVRIEPLSNKELMKLFRTIYPCVTVFKSQLPGQGKTESIYDHAASVNCGVKTLHISGPVDRCEIIHLLKQKGIKNYDCLHLDIGNVDRPSEIDTLIFELIVLGYISSQESCYSLVCSEIAIEIASTVNQVLFSELPVTSCFQTRNFVWNDFNDFKPLKANSSTTQVVCSYLEQLDQNQMANDLYFDDDTYINVNDEKCRKLLRKFFKATDEPSFTQVQIFISVLGLQLKKMSASSYFRFSHLKSMSGEHAVELKRQVIETMVNFSNEFAARSVSSIRSSQAENMNTFGSHREAENIVMNLVKRTSGMIRWESSNHLVLAFHGDFQTLSALYRDVGKVPENIKALFLTQIGRELKDFLEMSPVDLLQVLIRLARTSDKWMNREQMKEMIRSYALTPDNLLKMVLILIRMQAHVPVVIMGETGCGKTSLIRKLAQICDVKLDVFAIHAGISDKKIEEKVYQIDNNARSNYDLTFWLFLDEINTSEHIGLLSSIVCHHQHQGRMLAPNIHILSACNPYRLKNSQNRVNAGLKGKLREDKLSRLAYRVHPLPEVMLDYVWDYGTLPHEEEKTYIERMIDDLESFKDTKNVFVALLTSSQQFVRDKEGSACTVSLRDVERCKALSLWFYTDFLHHLKETPLDYSKENQLECIILALTVCYQCRFSENDVRRGYRDSLSAICTAFSEPFSPGKIRNVTKHVQDMILEKMDIPQGVARNTALQENVFLILICILNKIPLFLVGKPGCSKSLSMQLIRSNMRGPDSKSPLFKAYPRLYYTSFQGSESSTSEGILKVFERARRYRTEEKNVLSLVILDEVGLAEISRFNPLKVLHTLLEPDGTVPDVAVVGISNWALDAAKMNRAIHLSRPEMDREELFETAESINRSIRSDVDASSEKDTLLAMVDAYLLYTENQPMSNFHGLRDFYSFVKFFSRENNVARLNGTDAVDKNCILWKGIVRNFGGMKEHMKIAFDVFQKKLHMSQIAQTSVDQLIQENIRDVDSRHLMLILDGDSAIGQMITILKSEGKEVTLILGSQFEEDQDDDYNYRTLNKIILCMEQPNILILKDLENIYGSLYDMLNQNYTVVQNKKHCRVALGPYSNPTCEVHDQFRCIVAVDVRDLENADPPFLNRFEKQQFSLIETLGKVDKEFSEPLEQFLRDISSVSDKFSLKDTLAVFGDGFVASLLSFMKMSTHDEENMTILFRTVMEILWIMRPDAMMRIEHSVLFEKESSGVHSLMNLYFMLPIHNGLQHYLNEICNHDYNSPLITCQEIPGDIKNLLVHYFPSVESTNVQLNQELEISDIDIIITDSSTTDYEDVCDWTPPFSSVETLDDSLSTSTDLMDSVEHEENPLYHKLLSRQRSFLGANLIVFTYSTIYVSVGAALADLPHRVLKLGEVKSEKHLCDQLDEYWLDKEHQFLVIQCDTKTDLPHILFAKTTIENSQKMVRDVDLQIKKNVCLLLHVSRFIDPNELFTKINFLSGWPMAMLDSVEKQDVSLADLYGKTVMEALQREETLVVNLICREFPHALSMIRYSQITMFGQGTLDMIQNIRKSTVFLSVMADLIFEWVQQDVDTVESKDWLKKAAQDKHLLFTSTTMIGSLMTYMSNLIRQPMAMALFKLEEADALQSLLKIDEEELAKKTFFLRLLGQDTFFDINSVPKPTGPGCYVVTPKQLGLKTPFVRVYFQAFEKYREHVLEDLRKANIVPQFLSDQDDQSELTSIVNSIVNLYVPLYEKDIYKIENDAYEGMDEECFDDFCNYFSSEFPSRLSTQQRVEITRWVITKSVGVRTESFATSIVSLFIWGWLYSGRIFSLLQLLDLTPDHGRSAISKLKISSTSQSFTQDIEYLLEDICYDILPNEAILNSMSIQQWQEKVYSCIASLTSMGITTPTIYILKLFSDLVANYFIPHHVPQEELHDLANVVAGKGLGSKITFQTMISYLKRKRGVLSDEILQSVFCMFLSRSLESNPDSNEVMINALEEIQKGTVFEKEMLCFGPCLQVTLCDYEFDFDNDEAPLQTQLLYQIISNEQSTLLLRDDQFMNLIDKILSAEIFPSFAVLTMDLLEKFIYSKLVTVDRIMEISSHGDNILQKLTTAKVNVKENKGNLQFICSLSFLRVFIKAYTEAILYRKCRSKIVCNALNRLFADLNDQHDSTSNNPETVDMSKEGHGHGDLLLTFFYNTLHRDDGIFTVYRVSEMIPDPRYLQYMKIHELVHQPVFYELFQASNDETKQLSSLGNIDGFAAKLSHSLHTNDRDGILTIAAVLQLRLFVKQFHHKPDEEDLIFSECALKLAKDSNSEIFLKMFELLSMENHEFTRYMRCQNLNTMQTIFLCNWYCLNVCYSSNELSFLSLIMESEADNSCKVSSEIFHECHSVRYLSHDCTCSFRTVTIKDEYKECTMCHAKTSMCKIGEQRIDIWSSKRSNMVFDLLTHATRLCFSSEIPTKECMMEESEKEFPRLWDQLMKGLGIGSSELFSILMIFLHSNKEVFSGDPNILSKQNEKLRTNLDNILRHRFVLLSRNYEKIIQMHNLVQMSAFPKYLEIEKAADLLFVQTEAMTFESLQFELTLFEDETKYKFLRMVLDSLEEIKLPKHLLGLLSWHKIIMTKCRYKIKKIDCRFLSVGAFIQQQPRDHQRDIRKAFKAFMIACTEIRKNVQVLQTVRPDISQIGIISEESMLELCIIRDSMSPLYQIIDALVLLQNRFVNNAMLIAAESESYTPLSFLKQCAKTATIQIISVMDLRERHVIHFDPKEHEFLLDLSQCGTTADTRRSVHYDFRAIEAELAHVLIHGKPHIDFKNSIIFVEFKDDLYSQCVHLLHKLSDRIPQKEISDDLVSKMREKTVNDPTTIPELLRLFGTIAILLDRGIECRPTISVLSFLDHYVGNILQTDYKSVLPSHEYDLTLTHVVSFYMLLEELNGENFMESLDEEFKTRLPPSERAVLLENVCPYRTLTKLYCDALKLFLHRYLYIQDNNITGDQRLTDHMADPILWRGKLHLGKRKIILGNDEEYDFDDIMPHSLSIEHVYSIMDLLKTRLKEFEESSALPLKALNVAQQKKKSRRFRRM